MNIYLQLRVLVELGHQQFFIRGFARLLALTHLTIISAAGFAVRNGF